MRRRILDEATRLFAARGFGATSLQSVADAVGIAKPSLLYHFRSKTDLRLGVVDDLLARWKDVVPQILAAATSGENRFESALDEVLRFFHEDPDRARLLLREVLDHPAEMRARMEEHLSPWLNLVTDYIRRGQKEGVVHDDLDPEAWVMHVVSQTVATFAFSQVGEAVLRDDASYARRVRELVRVARTSLFLHTVDKD